MSRGVKESGLQRWSRIKREGGDGETVVSSVETGLDEAVVEDAVAPPDETKAEPAVRPEDLPNIDDLDSESDFTPFLKDGVPEELTRLALRKLWRSSPIYGFRDGLNEYDLDYSISETINAAVDTVYKVGKGMLSPEEEAAIDEEEATETAEALDTTPAQDEGADGAADAESDVDNHAQEEGKRGDATGPAT